MRAFITLFFLIAGYWSAFGQHIHGTLLNEANEPIVGAIIYNSRTFEHAHSNGVGYFEMDGVLSTDTVRISHIGYLDRSLPATYFDGNPNIVLEDRSFSLDEVVVSPNIDGSMLAKEIQIEVSPIESSQDLLAFVPGLFIGQHAGGGKAEQIFFRGFDIDHGTDLAIDVDGMPVNMVSHAHGQGYSDLHFLIPETVKSIEESKGPYSANKGNFATAGSVSLNTYDVVDENLIKFEVGQFNTQRIFGQFKLLTSERNNIYLASEHLRSDGPFESPQNFSRTNVFGKYKHTGDDYNLTLSLSHFESGWDASGQIPVRAVDAGIINRFGAIDDTEGGETSRTNVSLNYDKIISDNSMIRNHIYFSKYDFLLYSNFTFFLDDPENGDQIRQSEDRSLFGISSSLISSFQAGSVSGEWKVGLGLRSDQVNDNELSHTANRKDIIERIQFGDIKEYNFSAFAQSTFSWQRFEVKPILRLDHFEYHYNDALRPTFSTLTATKTIISPKLELNYYPGKDLQLFLKTGYGFHSNDSRLVLTEEEGKILPRAYGLDLGLNWKPTKSIFLQSTLWTLDMEEELVYVGDAGIVERSGATRRYGMDLGMKYQPVDWIFSFVDLTYSHARSRDGDAGNQYIPLAPGLTLRAGAFITDWNGFFGGMNVRFLDDRPANEDYSLTAEGYTIVDVKAGYRFGNVRVAVEVENVLNTEWNEAQFATLSRLKNEASAVEEIHFTPGNPVNVRGTLSYAF